MAESDPLAALVTALRDFGQHRPSCAGWSWYSDVTMEASVRVMNASHCDCGLMTALAAGIAALAGPQEPLIEDEIEDDATEAWDAPEPNAALRRAWNLAWTRVEDDHVKEEVSGPQGGDRQSPAVDVACERPGVSDDLDTGDGARVDKRANRCRDARDVAYISSEPIEIAVLPHPELGQEVKPKDDQTRVEPPRLLARAGSTATSTGR